MMIEEEISTADLKAESILDLESLERPERQLLINMFNIFLKGDNMLCFQLVVLPPGNHKR